MKVVIQRVKKANVKIAGEVRGSILKGFLILLGICNEDDTNDIKWLVKKITNLRVFNDDEGKMNLSIEQAEGDYLVISQFTLYANTKKGNRPSYIKAARPEIAIPLYEEFLSTLKLETNKTIACGEFGADMEVSLINDGPVTIIMDSKNKE